MRWAWEYFAFLANSFVFILIGMNVGDQPSWALGSAAAGVAILLVLAGRALSVYPLAALFAGSRWRLPATYQHTLFWGGLRGALALALALAVPATVPERGAIILTAFVVVAFSILVQGLTMPLLIARFGLAKARRARRLPRAPLIPSQPGVSLAPRTLPHCRFPLLLARPADRDDRADGDGHRHRLAGL